MKHVRRGVFFLVMATAIIFLYMPKAVAGDYLGEGCWSLHLTEDATGPADETFLMRVGVTHMGDSYFTVQGTVDIPDDNPVIMNGSAVIVGSVVFFTINLSQDHSPDSWRDTGSGQFRLDLSTLNGTFWVNNFDFNITSREFDQGYAAGTASFISCP